MGTSTSTTFGPNGPNVVTTGAPFDLSPLDSQKMGKHGIHIAATNQS